MNLKAGDAVIDATLGGGGHSRAILNEIGERGKLIAIDLDKEAIDRFKSGINNQESEIGNNIYLIQDNFANLRDILADLKIDKPPHHVLAQPNDGQVHGKSWCGGKVNAILADLGWSSDQLTNRGMSFREDQELDMRLDRGQELNAKKIVNEYAQEELEKIIRDYGEERFWRRIAGAIMRERKIKEIQTTKELAEIISQAIPVRYRYGRINPATRTFQAIRVEVNQELSNLKRFIPQALEALKSGGRLAIISFHSLEDRIVKNSFRENAGGCIFPRVKIITKKPAVATDDEVRDNPRARSAKLRVCELVYPRTNSDKKS